MAFNKQDFLTAFLERTTEGIETRSAEARQYEIDEKAAAKRSAPVITKRKQAAEAAVQMGQQLINMGVGKATVQTAMSTGMDGIVKLHDKITQAAAQRGMTRLGQADIDAIVNMPEIPALQKQYQDMELRDFAMKTYGAVAEKQVAPEQTTGMIGSLFGFGGRERVDARLADTAYGNGMSIADVNAAADLGDYQSLMPLATMTFMDVENYGDKSRSTFRAKMVDIAKDAVYSTEGKNALDAAYQDALTSPGGDITKAKKARDTLKDSLETKALDNYIRQNADIYAKGGFFTDQKTLDYIKAEMGPEYLAKLMDEYGLVVPEELQKEVEAEKAKAEKNNGKPPANPVLDKDPIVEDIRDKVQDDIGFKIVDGSLRVTKKDAEGKEEVMSVATSKAYFEDNKDVLDGLSYKVVEAQLKETEDKEAPMPEDLTDDQDNTNAAGEKIFELNSDGTAPAYPEDNFMENLMGADIAKKRRQKLWMKLFGKTHNPDGSLK